MLHLYDGVYDNAMLSMAKKINVDKSHSLNELHSLIPSGRRFMVLKSWTDRFRNIFVLLSINKSNDNMTLVTGVILTNINLMILWLLLPLKLFLLLLICYIWYTFAWMYCETNFTWWPIVVLLSPVICIHFVGHNFRTYNRMIFYLFHDVVT